MLDVTRLVVSLAITSWFGFLGIIAPVVVLLLFTYGARRRSRRAGTPLARATKWAAYAASFSFVAFCVELVHAISVSRRSTAFVGIVEIPLVGVPLAIVVFLVVWSLAVLVLARRASFRVPRVAVGTAVLLLVSGSVYFGADVYTGHVESRIAATESPDRLREYAHGTWAHVDDRVLVAVARNEHSPEDLIRELSVRSDDVQTALAYNRRTPFDVMMAMSKTNWSAAHNLAEPNGRYDQSVTADVLRELAAGRQAWDAVAKNPKTPPDALERLSFEAPEWVAGNPNTPEDVLRNIFAMTRSAHWPDYKVDIALEGLARNPHTPSDVREQLSRTGTAGARR